MKIALAVAIVAFMLAGCSTVKYGMDVTRITGNTVALSQQIDELQEELAPYIHSQQALKDLDDLQGDLKLMLLGDTRVGTVKELFDGYLLVKGDFVKEYVARKDKDISLEWQEALEKLYKELNLNDRDIEKSLENGTVDKVEVARYMYEFGKVGLRMYEKYKDMK